MILIISTEHDLSTDNVISWLRYFEIKYLRINSNMNVSCNNFTISNSDLDFQLSWFHNQNEINVRFTEITSCWYRRGGLNTINLYIDENDRYVSSYLNKEQSYLRKFVLTQLARKKHSIGDYYDNFKSKLEQLVIAKSSGLKIPDTFISSDIQKLFETILATSQITKGIENSAYLPNEYLSIGAGTHIVTTEVLNEFESVGLSLLQEEIKKEFELRIFFLHGDFYSMAIFSQNDPQTQVDFRNYNYDKKNRTVPFILPSDIKKKLKGFMNRIQMNSGSIDIIYTQNNDYFFLEVNPVGQFKQVSKPCNYRLEKEIAKCLINE